MTNEMQSVNPLMDFARKVECSVKLPSQGLLYDEDMINFNPIGEVDVMPMLPNDELLVVNPDSLLSGDAIVKLIKSCCPGIKRPEELYYPDVNALLLAIRKATYGDELIQASICPKCWDKKVALEEKEMKRICEERKIDFNTLSEEEAKEIHEEAKKNLESEIAEMEKNDEIKVMPIEFKYSIDSILDGMTLIPGESFVETKEGLKIYVTPYKCVDKILFSQRNINQQKILAYYQKSMKNENVTDENLEEYLEKTNKMIDMYADIGNKSMDILARSIKKIVLPNGPTVTKPEFIIEYIKNISSDLIIKLNDKITELNESGIKQTLEMKCPCCEHEWKEKFYGFNQSDFFGTSS